MTSKIGWGILGTADIARRQAIAAIRQSPYGEVRAIGSRDLQRARRFAEELGIPRAFGSYEGLLQADEVDAVYIALPNDMHLEWVAKAAEAGKDIVCEKPLGLNALQVQEIIRLAQQHGVRVMEAIPTYFHPIHPRVAELIRSGSIGELVHLRLSLGLSLRDRPDDYRWKVERGGGVLLDLGCYLVSLSRLLTGEEPHSLYGRGVLTPEGLVTEVAGMLTFPSATALIDMGIASAYRNQYEAIGTEGKITVERPFGNRAHNRTLTLLDRRGRTIAEESFTQHQMELQFAKVNESLIRGAPLPIPLAESLANARVIDALDQSIRQEGRPVSLIA